MKGDCRQVHWTSIKGTCIRGSMNCATNVPMLMATQRSMQIMSLLGCRTKLEYRLIHQGLLSSEGGSRFHYLVSGCDTKVRKFSVWHMKVFSQTLFISRLAGCHSADMGGTEGKNLEAGYSRA